MSHQELTFFIPQSEKETQLGIRIINEFFSIRRNHE